MEWIVLGALVAVAVGMIVYALLPGDHEKEEAVRRRSAGLSASQDPAALQSKAKQRASKAMLDKAAPFLSKPVMPKNAEEQSTLRARMATAGFRSESAPIAFLACKTIFGVGLCLLGLAYATGTGQESKHVLYYSIGGIGVGFLLPELWLRTTIRKRVEAIRNGLPDSLDLMVVAVESGLGLDAAMLRVSDEMGHVHPALAEEFQIAMIETQMGVTRAAALFKMSERCAVQEMRALVAMISQAEKLGTSIAKALRNQAETLRTKRRQKAEERAQKTAVKLLIPLVLFIFPAIFVVVAGPAVIHLVKTFEGGALKM
jgi:tight adherence protein C